MNDISKFIAKLIFYFVALVTLVWTASLTVTFVSNALPDTHPLVPYLALIVFDVGMIAWLYVFLRYAQGTIQRATALVACVVDFIGVALMVMAEILLGGQTLTNVPANLGTWAIWGIGVWTVLNVAAILVFHIGDPDAQLQMSIQNEKDAITREALGQLGAMRQMHSAKLAKEISGRMYQTLLDELMIDRDNNGRPDILEGNAELPPPMTEQQGREVAREYEDFLSQQPPLTQRGMEQNLQAYPYAGHRRNGNGQPPE